MSLPVGYLQALLIFKSTNKFDNPYEKQKIDCEKFIKKKLKKYFILRLGIVHSTGKIDY